MAIKKGNQNKKDNVFNRPPFRPDQPGGFFAGKPKKLKPTSKFLKAKQEKIRKQKLQKEIGNQVNLDRTFYLSNRGFQSPQQLKLQNLKTYGTMSGKPPAMKIKVTKRSKIDNQIPKGNFQSSTGRVVKTSGGTPKVTNKFKKQQKIKSQIPKGTYEPGLSFPSTSKQRVVLQTDNFELRAKPPIKKITDKDISRILGVKVRTKKIEQQIPGSQFGSARQKLSPQQKNQINKEIETANINNPSMKGFDKTNPNKLTMSQEEAQKLGQTIAATKGQTEIGTKAATAGAGTIAAAGATSAAATKIAQEVDRQLTGRTTEDKEFEQFVEPDVGGADEQLNTNLAEKPDLGTSMVNQVPDPENEIDDPQAQMTDPSEDLKEEDIQVQEYEGDPMTEPGQVPIVLPQKPELEPIVEPEIDTEEDMQQVQEYDGDPMTEPGQLPIVLEKDLDPIIEEETKTEEDMETVQEYEGDPMAEGMVVMPPPPPPGEDPPPPGEEKDSEDSEIPPEDVPWWQRPVEDPPADQDKKETPAADPPGKKDPPKRQKKTVTFQPEEEEKIIDGETKRPYKVNFTAITPSGNNKVFYQADTLKGTIREVPAGSVEVNPGLGLESMKVESTTSRNPLIKSKRDLLLRAERRGLL